MNRNILFSAGVVLLLLSLFLPWFTISTTQDSSYRENRYEDGKTIDTDYSLKQKWFLDRYSDTEVSGDSSLKTNDSYSGSYYYYEEKMEQSGSIDNADGLLFSIYKILIGIIILSFIILSLEAFGSEANLDSMKIGVTLLLTVVLLIFLTNIKDNLIIDRGNHVMDYSEHSNEYVNMSWSFGFKTLVLNDTVTNYYEITESEFETTNLTVFDYNNTWTGAYFVIYSGPGAESLEWDKTNSSTDRYYIWFDRNPTDENTTLRDPKIGGSGIRIDISDMSSETMNSEKIIRDRVVQQINSPGNPFMATANQTIDDRLTIRALYYGPTTNSNSGNMGMWMETNPDGNIKYEKVKGDTTAKINWYPSTGFLVALIGLGCFVGSRFED